MTGSRENAERCLVATCAHLALALIRDEDFPTWVNVLGEVLVDTMGCNQVLVPLRVAAEDVASAASGRDLDNALARLRLEVARYYRMAAAFRYKTWLETVVPRSGEA